MFFFQQRREGNKSLVNQKIWKSTRYLIEICTRILLVGLGYIPVPINHYYTTVTGKPYRDEFFAAATDLEKKVHGIHSHSLLLRNIWCNSHWKWILNFDPISGRNSLFFFSYPIQNGADLPTPHDFQFSLTQPPQKKRDGSPSGFAHVASSLATQELRSPLRQNPPSCENGGHQYNSDSYKHLGMEGWLLQNHHSPASNRQKSRRRTLWNRINLCFCWRVLAGWKKKSSFRSKGFIGAVCWWFGFGWAKRGFTEPRCKWPG